MNNPKNIGILDLEVYFPKQFVDESELGSAILLFPS